MRKHWKIFIALIAVAGIGFKALTDARRVRREAREAAHSKVVFALKASYRSAVSEELTTIREWLAGLKTDQSTPEKTGALESGGYLLLYSGTDSVHFCLDADGNLTNDYRITLPSGPDGRMLRDQADTLAYKRLDDANYIAIMEVGTMQTFLGDTWLHQVRLPNSSEWRDIGATTDKSYGHPISVSVYDRKTKAMLRRGSFPAKPGNFVSGELRDVNQWLESNGIHRTIWLQLCTNSANGEQK